MPELPEVEIIRRGLARYVGAGGFRVRFMNSDAKPLLEAAQIIPRLDGAGKLESVGRQGKYLILQWERLALACHLGMTGQLFVTSSPSQEIIAGGESHSVYEDHTHLVIEFTPPILRQQKFLVYRDPRKFGWWGKAQHARLSKLGPDALDRSSELPTLLGALSSRRSVYNCLLDQSFVAGLGNIYVCETLFRAGVHPLRLWDDLEPVERKAIGYYIGEVVQEAIEHGGSSISDYIHVDGTKGEFQLYHAVYGRGGMACRKPGCSGKIERIEHSSRSVFFCPNCQPKVPERVEV